MHDENRVLSREPLGESTTAQTPGTARAWIVAATVIGTTIEWYDFFIYGTAAALVFNKVFFPSFDAAAGTIAAFATFAIGLLARPFGGSGVAPILATLLLARFGTSLPIAAYLVGLGLLAAICAASMKPVQRGAS